MGSSRQVTVWCDGGCGTYAQNDCLMFELRLTLRDEEGWVVRLGNGTDYCPHCALELGMAG